MHNLNDRNDLQKALNSLVAWSHKRMLKFNAEKCVVFKKLGKVELQEFFNGIYLDDVEAQSIW